MSRYETADGLVRLIRDTTVGLVRRAGPDLSARQLGVFLTCYTERELQTVRALAGRLNVSKPAITRALDRLAEFDLIRRLPDPVDRRSILIARTQEGTQLYGDIVGFLAESSQSPDAARPRAAQAEPDLRISA